MGVYGDSPVWRLTQEFSAASASLSATLNANAGRLIRVAQIGGPALSRLDCFVAKPWRKMADALADPQASAATVFDLLDNRCPVVPGSDYDAWYYVDRAFLQTLAPTDEARSLPNPDDRLIQLWFATMIWGHARDNRGPGKVGAAITTFKRPGDHPAHLHGPARPRQAGRGLTAACTYLQAGYLAGFGESFFTKWLWSAGLAAGQRPLPLVFDDRVRAALRTIGPTWALAGGNDGPALLRTTARWPTTWQRIWLKAHSGIPTPRMSSTRCTASDRHAIDLRGAS